MLKTREDFWILKLTKPVHLSLDSNTINHILVL